MAEQFYTLVTNIGKAKIANANALGTKINFDTLKVGDSNGSYYEPTEAQENLVHEVWSGKINSIAIDPNNPNWIVIDTIIPSDTGGFIIREAGIFDTDGNMLAVAKYPETYKPTAENGATKDLTIENILEVSNTSSVNLKIDPTVILATKQDVKNLQTIFDSQMVENTIYLAGGTANSITVTTANGNYTYAQFKRLSIKATADNTGNVTINVDGKGAVSALKYDGSELATGSIKSGKVYNFYYDTTGNCFFLIAKASGNTIAAHVLAGDTCSTDNGDVVGSMANNGAIIIAPSGSDQMIPAGYHNGQGKIKAIQVTAGDVLINANDASVQQRSYSTSPYYQKLKETVINTGEGIIRVSFNAYSTWSWDPASGKNGWVRLYKNDSPIGDEHCLTAYQAWMTFTQDIAVKPGDKIQVYAKPPAETTNTDYDFVTIQYLRFFIANNFVTFANNS